MTSLLGPRLSSISFRPTALRRTVVFATFLGFLFSPAAPLMKAGPPFAQFIDPHPSLGNQFGFAVVPLSTGNVVITSPFDDAGGSNAGAVYLFNGATGALISTLTGSTAGDEIGSRGVIPLTNGNFVIPSGNWDNGSAINAGAVTWASGTTGINGAVSAANSLVGTAGGDLLGASVTALTNGNYVVTSPNWSNGAAANAGAATWGDGATGVSGPVTPANSLVGTTASDQVGEGRIIALSNGNYVVKSGLWDNGAATNAGAVTWGNGATGVWGPVSSSNSLVGTTALDAVGGTSATSVNGNVVALINGNYVVNSPRWDNGPIADAGAATWGSGTTGISGPVSAANSLVGIASLDSVGSAVTALTNGNYVVTSLGWANGVTPAVGAVTWGSGTSGIVGPVSAANSLVGSTASDIVGHPTVTALTNGNYVVCSQSWDNPGVVDVGAATWGNGATGTTGPVTVSNSLVGTKPGDFDTCRVTPLTNGNYVVRSPSWDNAGAIDAGAVTWGDGARGTTGVVSATNSLVGTRSQDCAGCGGVTALNNGNYVVSSPIWNNGSSARAGAISWGSGVTGISGEVSALNSVVGTRADDRIGDATSGVTALTNGNYVVRSPGWANGGLLSAGAVTWGNGATGTVGPVSAANSLVGSKASDRVGNGGVFALTNGNYVVISPVLGGAATFGSGTAGITGPVSESNSLVGATGFDSVGNGGVTALSNGNYVVRSGASENVAPGGLGAATWANGTTGLTGLVSLSNSLVVPAGPGSLLPLVVDDGNGTFLARFRIGSGIVHLGSQGDGIAPTLGAASASNVGATSADLSGSVPTAGGVNTLQINARGFVYSVTASNSNPLLNGAGVTTSSLSGTTGAMTSTVGGLTAATGYSFRAYATNASGTAYSAVVTFNTVPVPTVGSPTSTGITGTAATLGGNVTSDGGSAITERGVVYSLTTTNADPLIGGTGVTKSTVSGTTGLFTSSVAGLLTVSGYSYKAYATNIIGTSYTPVATFTTIATVPDAPTIGTATAGNTTASVAFTPPGSTGGSTITGYTATCGTKSASGTTSPITVTGLTNGTAVTCTVLATNGVGNSVASAASNSVTPTVGSGISRTVCASGCGFTRIQDAINASAPGDRVLVKSTYDSAGAGEVFPIQTTAIKGQNPAGTVTIAGETDGNGNPITKIKTRNVTGLDGIMMVSPGVVSDLKIVPGDGTRPNRVIAAGSGNTCPGSTCHLKGGLTIRNVVIDFTVIDGTTAAHFNTGNGVDLLADDVLIDKVTIKGIAGNSILVDGDNSMIRNSTLDGRDPTNGNAIRGTLAIGFGADNRVSGAACSGFPTNYTIDSNTIVGYTNGVVWCSGRNSIVSNNTITDISNIGIFTSGSQGTQIFGNILQNNTTGAWSGISLSNNGFQTCSGNIVRNNKVLGRALRDMERGINVQSCVDTTIFQNEVRDFADVANGGAIYASMIAGVATKTTIQGNTVIGGDGPGIVYIGADSGATAVDQSVIRDNVVNEFKRNGIVVQFIKGVRSGAGAGNVVAYNTVRAVNLGLNGDTHAFNLQNLANTAFDRNTALDTRGSGAGFFLANSTGVNGNCNTGSTNGGGLFAQVNVTPVYGNANVNCRVALYSRYDFDNDGGSDVTMYRHTTGEWFTRNSSNGADTVTAFGAPGSDDIPAPGNYTAVGRTDRAIYRYTTGEWYIRRATDGGTTVITFGSPLVGDVPMPADYDGDGLTDLAVFRTSTANAEWYIRLSSTGATQYVAWGCAACADLGVPGDYDGDGKADVAVYRRSTGDWFIRKSTDTALQQIPFGDSAQGDIPVPGRYTQTGKTDMAVYRSLTGEWFIRRSTDFGITSVQFGNPSAGDFPVSADFTQSGITDIAIYRPTPPTAQFMIRKSTDFSTLTIPYGNPGSQDAPLTAR